MHTRTQQNREMSVPLEASDSPQDGQIREPAKNLRAGERLCVTFFFSYAFLLLVCYYILKTLREPLLLQNGSAELKSYAYATVALALLVLVPLYSTVIRHVSSKARLVRGVTVFSLVNLVLLYLAGRAGIDIGFLYYVWVGIFGVTILTQFWAYAADTFNVLSGQRLFPAIAVGAALGGLVGPAIAGSLFDELGPWTLLAIAASLLALTLPLIRRAGAAVPAESRSALGPSEKPAAGSMLSGFALVLRDRYLLLLAVFVILLNYINTTGEYLLTDLVLAHADARVQLDPSLQKEEVIAAFYGNFYVIINALTFATQVFLVGRVFRWIGVQGALLVLPILALIGYGLIAFLPIFTMVRWVKICEDTADYSVNNTSRHALFLPLTTAAKYEGKTTIDTFCCRLGDLLQAGVIFVGLNWLDFDIQHFALLNVVCAFVWLVVAVQLAQRYRKLAPQTAATSAYRSLFDWRQREFRVARVFLKVYRSFATALLTALLAIAMLTLPAPAKACGVQPLKGPLVLAPDGAPSLDAFSEETRIGGCGDMKVSMVGSVEPGRNRHVKAALICHAATKPRPKRPISARHDRLLWPRR